MNFSDTIQLAHLPEPGQDCRAPGSTIKGRVLDVAGWGQDKTNTNRDTNGVLWTVKRECLPDKFCESDENQVRTGVLPEIQLCVGDSENLANNACQGDSGGMYTTAIKYI